MHIQILRQLFMHSILDQMQVEIESEQQMRQFGERLGRMLKGGEVFELVGDVGAGKTVLTKGLAVGLDISDPIQSPTFTINRVYSARDGLELRHYDFYRLNDAGIMADELAEALADSRVIVVVEWAGLIEGVLPDDRLRISIETVEEEKRSVNLKATGPLATDLLEVLK